MLNLKIVHVYTTHTHGALNFTELFSLILFFSSGYDINVNKSTKTLPQTDLLANKKHRQTFSPTHLKLHLLPRATETSFEKRLKSKTVYFVFSTNSLRNVDSLWRHVTSTLGFVDWLERHKRQFFDGFCQERRSIETKLDWTPRDGLVV